MGKDDKSPKKRNRALVIVVLAFVALYVPSFFHWVYGDKTEVAFLTQGSIEETVEAPGLIIRDEEVINSPFTGRCVINIQQGEKAASGEAIATLLKDSSVGAMEELRNKDLEILKAKNEKAKAQEIFSEDISKVDNDISAKLKLLVLGESNGNSEEAWTLRQDIDKLIEKKADILGGTGGSDAKVLQLVNERNQLQNLVNSYTKQVCATVPGIVSYAVDGLEGALPVNKIQDLNIEKFESLQPQTKEIKGNAIPVEQNKPLFKLLKGIDQYITLELTVNETSGYEVGKTTKKLRVMQVNKIYDGVVYNISNPENGKVLVTFKADKGVNDTSLYRKVNVEIVEKASSGFKVPVKSLIDYDKVNGTASVMFLKANYATSKKVDVVESNDEYAIIATPKDSTDGAITLYDNYLVNPQNVQEGQLIEK